MNPPHIYLKACQFKTTLFHISLKGSDARTFFQGQSTQSLDGHLKFHAFVERTGKINCHFLAYIQPEGISIWAARWACEPLLERFQKFVVSEDVEWSEPELMTLYFTFNHQAVGEVSGHWEGVKVALSLKSNDDLLEVSDADFKTWCLWQGIPELSDESLKGEVINQTLLLSHAVDFKKGCFPGQEAVAKIQNLKGAAWAPVLFHKKNAKTFPSEVALEDKVVAQIRVEKAQEDWAPGKALRDIRVHNLALPQDIIVRLYPRWPSDSHSRAQEIYHLGTDAFQKGKEEDAFKYWKFALEIEPKFAEAYEAIGVLLGRQEKFIEAEEWMNRLLKVDPDSIMAHTNLSLFLMRQDRIEEAEKHKAMATVASFKNFGKEASQKKDLEAKKAQEQAEMQRREDMFRQVLEIDSEDTLALSGMGQILLEKEDPKGALEYFHRVINADEKYSVAYLYMGKCLMALGELGRAKEIFQKGIKIAAQKGDLMPANEMQTHLLSLK